MNPLWWILAVVGAVVLLATALTFALFFFTFGRHQEHPPVEGGSWDAVSDWTPFKEVFIAENQWIKAHITNEYMMKSRDGLKLVAHAILQPGATRTAVLFHGYHGYAPMDFAPTMRFYYEMGMNVFFVDERAMNGSEGRIITFGVKESEDLVDWLKLINREIPDQELILGGVSMGAATVMMALRFELPPNVKAVVSDCGFTSPWEIIERTQKAWMPWVPHVFLHFANVLCRLLGGFSMKEVDTREILAKTDIPVCFIHGDKDDFVPTAMGIANYEACASKKKLLLVKGATHAASGLVDPEAVHQTIKDFLNDVFE